MAVYRMGQLVADPRTAVEMRAAANAGTQARVAKKAALAEKKAALAEKKSAARRAKKARDKRQIMCPPVCRTCGTLLFFDYTGAVFSDPLGAVPHSHRPVPSADDFEVLP